MVRYSEGGKTIERGPFHHSHIQDLLEFNNLPTEFEISSDLENWIPIQEHAIFPLLNIKSKWEVQETNEFTPVLTGSTNVTDVKEVLWYAMSEEERAAKLRSDEMLAHEAKSSTKTIRGIQGLVKLLIFFALPSTLLVFSMLILWSQGAMTMTAGLLSIFMYTGPFPTWFKELSSDPEFQSYAIPFFQSIRVDYIEGASSAPILVPAVFTVILYILLRIKNPYRWGSVVFYLSTFGIVNLFFLDFVAKYTYPVGVIFGFFCAYAHMGLLTYATYRMLFNRD